MYYLCLLYMVFGFPQIYKIEYLIVNLSYLSSSSTVRTPPLMKSRAIALIAFHFAFVAISCRAFHLTTARTIVTLNIPIAFTLWAILCVVLYCTSAIAIVASERTASTTITTIADTIATTC